jgi:hypothetical protein
MSKEKCVICGEEIVNGLNDSIKFTTNNMDFTSQLCTTCESKNTMIIPKDLVSRYPNNYELGEKIREFYNQYNNKLNREIFIKKYIK